MPKERRSRATGHQPSVTLPKRTYAIGGEAVEHVEIASGKDASAQEILKSMEESNVGISLTKKDKLALKREAFLQKLELSRTHSKSHERRMKRKAKEQLASGLTDMQDALAALEEASDSVATATSAQKEEPTGGNRAGTQSLKIGEGKSEPLSRSQRKRALQLERLRQPLILTNPAFSSNPFSTVRLHAQNTLLKHNTQS